MYIVNKKTFANVTFTHPNNQGLVTVTIRQDGKKEKKTSYTRDEEIKDDYTWAKFHFWNKWHVIQNPVLAWICGSNERYFAIVETVENSISHKINSYIHMNGYRADSVTHLEGETTEEMLKRVYDRVEIIAA